MIEIGGFYRAPHWISYGDPAVCRIPLDDGWVYLGVEIDDDISVLGTPRPAPVDDTWFLVGVSPELLDEDQDSVFERALTRVEDLPPFERGTGNDRRR
ncbi:MAG: hypothetical protein D6812_16905 [Deltaproteobacteria bacterium]|nr:MAG: hypothetical protein D6812_16905 [Deltaproteobacteria bacterium]